MLTTVSKVDPLRVLYQLGEQEYLELERDPAMRNAELELVLSDGTVFPHKGHVLLTGRNVDVRTGTIAAIGLFPNPGNVLRPGQYAKVRAVVKVRKGAILVPQRAVNEMQGAYQVAVVGADDKAQIRTVKAAERVGSMWVIESGLCPGRARRRRRVLARQDGDDRRARRRRGGRGFGDGRAAPDRRAPGSDAMARFFINRPIVAIVIAILTVLGGLVAMLGLPVAQFPDIVPPLIQIQTSYPGADALTIEQSVATPIEQQMNGVEDMLYLQSVNANDGTITVRVTFDVGTDRNADQVNAQNRVAQALPSLPVEVNQFGLTYRKTQGTPLVLISLYSPKGTYDGLFLGNYALINVNDALYRVNGVGQVLNFGASEYAMRIWIHPDQLAKLGLTVGDLSRAVQQQSTVNPAGQVGAEPAPKGQEFTYAVRSQGRLLTPEQFAKIVVRLNPGRLGRAPRRRLAHRARRADVQADRTHEREGGVDHRHLPGAGIERARRVPGRPQGDGRAQGALPGGHRLRGLRRHDGARHGRHPRDRHHALRGDASRPPRRLPVPPELAGDAHPARRRARCRSSARSPSFRSSGSRSTRCRSSGSSSRSGSSSTTRSSSSRPSSTTSRRG